MKKFLSIFTFVFVLSVFFCFSTSAETINTEYTDANGIVWRVTVYDEDMTAAVNGVNLTEMTKEFVIPSVVTVNDKEYTVTVIGVNAFNNNQNVFGKLTLPAELKEIKTNAFRGTYIYDDVIIPETVTTLGDRAFGNCIGLRKITLPASVTSLPIGIFENCTSLTTVVSEGEITRFSNNAFDRCTSLIDIVLGENIIYIGDSAFSECLSLIGDLNLSNATTIGNSAFYSCKGITRVTIGTATFSPSTFYGCASVVSFDIHGTNSKYISENGILFSRDMTILYHYPAAKVQDIYTVPDTVTQIGENAFAYAANLKKILLNDAITTIGNNAFAYSGLESVYFSDKVTAVGNGVLTGAGSLKWIIIGSGVSSMNSISNVPSLNIMIAKNPNFNNNTGIQKFSYAITYECTSHFYGYLDIDADCEDDGIKTCVLCGKSSVVSKLGHSGIIVETSSLSCTTDEYTVIDCKRCNQIVKNVTAECSGHDKTEIIINGTDQKNSKIKYNLYRCRKCNDIFYENFSANIYTVGDINGDEHIDSDDVALLGSYLGGVSVSVNLFACDLNGDKKIDVLDLLILRQYVAQINVSFDAFERVCNEHIRQTKFNMHTATCKNKGLAIEYCLDCGTILSSETTDLSEHDFTTNMEIKASCSANGSLEVTCNICGEHQSIIIEKLAHTQNWWTLPERGFEYNICQVCGVFESREVDYTLLDEIIQFISPYYETYYTTESAALVRPILANYEKSLTQAQVDALVKELENVLPRIKYNANGVPVIYLETAKSLNRETYVWANIAVVYYDENGALRTVSDFNGQIRIRGNSTANSNKYPFNIKFTRDVDLLGLGAGKKYCLMANLYDKTMIRNALAIEFANSLGLDYTPKYEFADLYINGVYNGTYMITTPMDVDENRIEIDKETDFLLETENRSGGDFYITSPIFKIKALVDSPEDMSSEAISKLYMTMYQIDFVILSGNWEEIQKYIDVESIAKYYVLHEYTKEVDILSDSTRFYIKDGKLYGGPIWDFDLSMGNVTTNGGGDHRSFNAYWNNDGLGNGVPENSSTGTWADINWKENSPYNIWFYYLNKYSPEFMELVKQYILEYQSVIVNIYEDITDDNGDVISQNTIDFLSKNNDIRDSFDRNYNKLSFSASYSNLSYNTTSINSYNDAIEYLRDWFRQRNEWLLNYYFPSDAE